MQGQATSGQPTDKTRLYRRAPAPTAEEWQRWEPLHTEIIRNVRACDQQGEWMTIERLAELLGEAVDTISRRVDELQVLQRVRRRSGGRVMLGLGLEAL